MEQQWTVYILQCRDGTFYTGITDDLNRRIARHNAGKGAKYTRGRTPVVLKYAEQCLDHSQALRREYQIKKMTRTEKMLLIGNRENAKPGCD